MNFRAAVLTLAFLLLWARPGEATWSIILVDTRTKEIAIGSVTCLNNFDLLRATPVMLVEVGGACSQGLLDIG